LPLSVTFLESGVARITLDEERRQKGDIVLRHESKARKERYNEVEDWVIVGGLDVSKGAAISKDAQPGTTVVRYGPAGTFEAVIQHFPFAVEFKRDGATHIKFNDRGFLNMEHWRPKVEKPQEEPKEEPKEGEEKKEEPAPETGEDENTWWDEVFGGNTDSKPKGPESVALDITFPGYEHVYGVPSHAGPLSLKQTR
jgi:mannosyl-oligosaccharide alpha-1,3-glucosidase